MSFHVVSSLLYQAFFNTLPSHTKLISTETEKCWWLLGLTNNLNWDEGWRAVLPICPCSERILFPLVASLSCTRWLCQPWTARINSLERFPTELFENHFHFLACICSISPDTLWATQCHIWPICFQSQNCRVIKCNLYLSVCGIYCKAS